MPAELWLDVRIDFDTYINVSIKINTYINISIEINTYIKIKKTRKIGTCIEFPVSPGPCWLATTPSL